MIPSASGYDADSEKPPQDEDAHDTIRRAWILKTQLQDAITRAKQTPEIKRAAAYVEMLDPQKFPLDELRLHLLADTLFERGLIQSRIVAKFVGTKASFQIDIDCVLDGTSFEKNEGPGYVESAKQFVQTVTTALTDVARKAADTTRYYSSQCYAAMFPSPRQGDERMDETEDEKLSVPNNSPVGSPKINSTKPQ